MKLEKSVKPAIVNIIAQYPLIFQGLRIVKAKYIQLHAMLDMLQHYNHRSISDHPKIYLVKLFTKFKQYYWATQLTYNIAFLLIAVTKSQQFQVCHCSV